MAEFEQERITFRIDDFEAVDNPEVFGRAEWSLRVLVNDIERWRSASKHRVAEGGRAVVDAQFHVDIPPHSNEMSLRIEAEEHDLGPNEHAVGEVRLFRSMRFGGDHFTVNVYGEDSHLRVRCSATMGWVE